MATIELPVSPSELGHLIEDAYKTREPLWVWGPPGCSKSSVVAQTAKKLDIELRDIRAVTLDPADLRGLPKVDGESTTFCPPSFWPRKGRGILFFDELAQAEMDVQNGLLQLTLDRWLGEYRLPDEWVVVAASNRMSDKAGVKKVSSALLSRFLHVDLTISTADWQEWAANAGVHAAVRAFISYKPDMLFQFDPATNPRSFPCPRAWTTVGSLVSAVRPQLLQRAVAGKVGTGPAAEFMAFLELFRQLPSIDGILKDPSGHVLPTQPSLLHALCGALAHRARGNANLARALCVVSSRVPDEFSVMLLRDALAIAPRLAMDQDVSKQIASARKKGLLGSAA